MKDALTATYGHGLYGEGLYGCIGLIPGTTIPGIGGGITVWFELWRATIDNGLVEDISHLLYGGNVDMNRDRAITTQATFNLKDVSAVDPYTDFLAVFQNVEYDDTGIQEREQLGLFTVRVPSGTRSIERAEGIHAGYDLTSILGRYAFTDAYNVPQGTNYVDAVITLLGMAGITRSAIEATDKVTATPVTFPLGTTYLEACNTLLEAIGYYTLAVTPDGKPTSGPTRDVQYIEPFRTVTDNDLMSTVEMQPTDTSVANIIIVIQDNPNADPLTAIRRNDEPDSPTSTVSLGEIVRVETRSDLADQAAVDALADRLLSESRTFYQVATVRLLPDARVLVPSQTIDLDLTGQLEILNGRWRVRTSSIGFSPEDSGPVLEINRVTDRLRGALI